jgi:hypothetical protein
MTTTVSRADHAGKTVWVIEGCSIMFGSKEHALAYRDRGVPPDPEQDIVNEIDEKYDN